MFRSSSSHSDSAESMIYGTGDQVKKLLEQHRQMQPKSLQHLDGNVAKINCCNGCSDNQPGKLLEGFQLQVLSPGHYTDSPVPGEKENVLILRSILTPEDYESGQGSSSSAATHSASELMIAKSQHGETTGQISDITDNSSSTNCHPVFTDKLSILETTDMMRNGDTSHRHANADSAVKDPFRSPIIRSTKVSVLRQSAKPANLEPRSTVEAEEHATEQTNQEDSYLTGLSSSDDGLHDGSANGHSVFLEYFEMRSPSVLTQQNMWISTDNQSSSTSRFNYVQNHSDGTVGSSLSLRVINDLKPARRQTHKKVHENRFRRAEESVAKFKKNRRHDHQQKKRNKDRRISEEVDFHKAKLTLEEQAMKAFPGIPPQKAIEAHYRRKQAKIARAQSPIFIFDEQRIIMDNFEEENGQELDRMDQFEHEEEHIGWMADGGFGGDVGAGGDVAENDFLAMDGFGNQEDIEFALMEGDDAFAQSSLAHTPPQH